MSSIQEELGMILAKAKPMELGAVIGITLPFVVYTTMSSAIAVIIGPVGWIGAGLFAIWKLTGANYKRLMPALSHMFAKLLRFHLGLACRVVGRWRPLFPPT